MESLGKEMNNCKNCGARYHPSKCDYCGTPHATEAVNMKGQQFAYLQGSLSYESVRQLYNGKGLVQLTVPPHRSIRGTFWSGLLQGVGTVAGYMTQVPWWARF